MINVGDALQAFTAGFMRSSWHRVVAPPKELGQDGETRYSLVYFVSAEHGAKQRVVRAKRVELDLNEIANKLGFFLPLFPILALRSNPSPDPTTTSRSSP